MGASKKDPLPPPPKKKKTGRLAPKGLGSQCYFFTNVCKDLFFFFTFMTFLEPAM